MKRLLFAFLTIAAAIAHGQTLTTNVARPVVSITRLEAGVFVNYSAEIGRLYRLESSITLTNWALVAETIADGTNMQFFIENPNITFVTPTNTGGGGGSGGPPPFGFNSMSMSLSSAMESEETKPLPYPWEPKYQPGAKGKFGGGLSAAGGSSMMLNGGGEPESLTSFQQESTFYRVRCPDVRIAFPNWVPYIDQFLNFTVATTITNAGSTYRYVLYQDGVPKFTNTAAVPASGTFGVSDGTYDAGDWPFTGYYAASTWSLAGTITPAGAVTNEDQTAQFLILKNQRSSFPVSRGLVANQHGSLIFISDWFVVDDDFEREMLNVYNFNLAGAYQVDIHFAFRDPPQYVLQNLQSIADWTAFKSCIYSNPLSHLHYFGHGAPDKFGGAATTTQIRLADLKKSRLTNQPMHYVALDGCQIVKNSTDMISAFIGYKKRITRLEAAANGFIPGYGWGWKENKPVGYRQKGLLFDKHFWFIDDFYDKLNSRSPVTDLLDRTYEQSRIYALDPQGAGYGGSSNNHNSEGEDFTYTGCYTCYFDDF